MKSFILFLVLLSSVSLIQIKNSSLNLKTISSQNNVNDKLVHNGILEIAISNEVKIESISLGSELIDISELSQLKPMTVGTLNVTIHPKAEIKIDFIVKAFSPIKPSFFEAKIEYTTINNRKRTIYTNADWTCNNEEAKSYGQSPDRLDNLVLINGAEFIWSKNNEDKIVSCSIVTQPN